ncbi:MAG: response regulator, partial [Deltaproteobacteria bacterium]|nr:response regulator [Deltaproteobacteria bacterium]
MVKPNIGRLLIVDDETELMTVLCETLDARGYRTSGFTSAKEALEHFKNEEYDLLLTDLMMPDMDGIVFLKKALE